MREGQNKERRIRRKRAEAEEEKEEEEEEEEEGVEEEPLLRFFSWPAKAALTGQPVGIEDRYGSQFYLLTAVS